MFKRLLSGLFGGHGSDETNTGTKAAEPVEYKEYLIVSQPDHQSGQYRVSGWIRKLDNQGEDFPPFENGLPKVTKLKLAKVEQKLPTFTL
jgi:hypothetical protein